MNINPGGPRGINQPMPMQSLLNNVAGATPLNPQQKVTPNQATESNRTLEGSAAQESESTALADPGTSPLSGTPKSHPLHRMRKGQKLHKDLSQLMQDLDELMGQEEADEAARRQQQASSFSKAMGELL